MGRFGVAIPEGLEVAGVILVDQYRILDWRQRTAELITRLPKETVAAVMRKFDTVRLCLSRAERLCALRNEGMPAAEAWRAVKPDTTANDRAAAEQARREIRWYHALLERLHGKLCRGVADRPCGKRVASARHTYCAACGARGTIETTSGTTGRGCSIADAGASAKHVSVKRPNFGTNFSVQWPKRGPSARMRSFQR